MCYTITELYSDCRCLYYKHDIDKCASSGRPGHAVQKRTILVGYACSAHSPDLLSASTSEKVAADGTARRKLQLKPRPAVSRLNVAPCHATISKDFTAGEGARRAELFAFFGQRLRGSRWTGAGLGRSGDTRAPCVGVPPQRVNYIPRNTVPTEQVEFGSDLGLELPITTKLFLGSPLLERDWRQIRHGFTFDDDTKLSVNYAGRSTCQGNQLTRSF
ncbi:hypothetical protein CSOJ01_09721 [Colletotrichum sojae]|uniref:Uncharacterized protein n=1 Tax=Colletotrichum sojae TaxID=2175907 RepID=A0A8H6J2Q4_9PEZI|nr:hypothetical protein CSOJ01_09721 [Colletotrichum sojae]